MYNGRTRESIQQVQDITNESPQKSMRSIAKYLGVHETTIQRTVHKKFSIQVQSDEERPFYIRDHQRKSICEIQETFKQFEIPTQ